MSGGLAVSVRELAASGAALIAPRRSAERIRRRALRELNAQLALCRDHIPAYQVGYPRALASLTDLESLPVLTKEAVRANPETFRAPGLSPADYRVDVTSGTTGQRLEVWHDVGAYGYHGATVFRRFLLSGYRPWWPIAHIKPFARPTRWFQRIGLFPRTVVNAGQSERAIAAELLRLKPKLVMGYPLVLRGVLRALGPEERRRLGESLRMVMTDSEQLTAEAAQAIADGYGVPVFDEYSAYEVLTIATQCRAGSMHLDDDRVWVEFLDEHDEPVPIGEVGRVTVSHYLERAMPLLRYSVGDLAREVPGRCSCGSRFRRLSIESGRVNDFLTLPDGRRIYSGVFLSLAMYATGVAECMVRQDSAGAITVHLVPETPTDDGFEAARRGFTERFRQLVDVAVPVRFVRAERVELTVGGKGRFVESEFHPDQP